MPSLLSWKELGRSHRHQAIPASSIVKPVALALCGKPRSRSIRKAAVVVGDNGSADRSRPMEDRGDSGRLLRGDRSSEGSPTGTSLWVPSACGRGSSLAS